MSLRGSVVSSDRFFDVVVLVSVALLVLLAAGVGMLVLQNALR